MSNKEAGAERRQAPRLEVDYDLQVSIQGEHVPYTGLLKDISCGGLFLTTDRSHRVGDRITIRFAFPDWKEPVEAVCRVQWLRDHFTSEGTPTGIGVQFEDLTAEVAARINAYIKDKDVPFYDEGF